MKKLIIDVVSRTQFAAAFLPGILNRTLIRNYGRLKTLKNKFNGNRCFIMGNGPSLQYTALEKLENEYVFGLNRCYLLYNDISWRPAFYTAVDDVVVPDIADEINEVIGSSPQTTFFFPEVYYHHKLFDLGSNVLFFRQIPPDPTKGHDGFFSSNSLRYLRTPYTVTLTALQLAVYLGFNPIYLIGCDTDYQITPNVHMEGSTIDPASGERIEGYIITSQSDNDINHFSRDYFGSGRKWHYPNVKGMMRGYGFAKKCCQRLGVQVYNATIGGKLEIFPRADFNTILEMKENAGNSSAANERPF